MALTIPSRTPWDDRFRTPSVSELRSSLASQFHPPFDHARAKLAQLMGAPEAIRWHGVWKWTLEYAASTPGDLIVFLVADPARPRVCISVSDATMSAMDLRKMAKGMRDVLASAPGVDGTRWATWDVVSKSGVDEIGAFIVAYRTTMGIPAVVPAPTPSKARDAKAKPASASDVAHNGVASPSTGHKAGSNGTRRARGT